MLSYQIRKIYSVIISLIISITSDELVELFKHGHVSH